MRKGWLVVALLLSLAPGLSAQRVLTASGSYTYYAPSNITLDQAKAVALERAKVQIIADRFGTVIGVRNYSRIENGPDAADISFLSLGESEVKGEWLETIGKPLFDIRYEENLQVVHVTVQGKIREIVRSAIPVEARVLRNGISDKYESELFKQGDDLYVSIKAPVDGFVAIFLYDKEGVNRLLPVKHDRMGSRPVKAGDREVFFPRLLFHYDAEEDKVVDRIRSEYQVTCTADNELNRIYVVFSTNAFTRPNDELPADEHEPAFLSFEQFQRWLSRSRRKDPSMTVIIKDILIRE